MAAIAQVCWIKRMFYRKLALVNEFATIKTEVSIKVMQLPETSTSVTYTVCDSQSSPDL